MNQIAGGNRVIVRGAGEMASGVIRRLHLVGFRVLALEQAAPECIRRTVSFAETVYEKRVEIEGVVGVLIDSVEKVESAFEEGLVPIMIDPQASCAKQFHPNVLVDARMLKESTDSSFLLAPKVIGLGPGFTAGRDCHAVVESNRGFNLGRVIYRGAAEQNTGVPGTINSVSGQRVLRSPVDGKFEAHGVIAEMVTQGQKVGTVDSYVVTATIDGCLRGLIRSGTIVRTGQKIGDIDPRGIREYCFLISEKANAIAGGVLEAVLRCLAEA